MQDTATCKQNLCNNNVITTDGYCKKHSHYTDSDFEYITKHVSNYLKKVQKTEGKINKLKIVNNLWYYLSYKVFFIQTHDNFKKTIIDKGKDILSSIDKEDIRHTSYAIHFINLNDKLMNQIKS